METLSSNEMDGRDLPTLQEKPLHGRGGNMKDLTTSIQVPTPQGNPEEESKQSSEIDSILVQELNKLTMEERSQTLYDVHGVAEPEDENPVMIETKLAQMNSYIQQIPELQRTSYNKALKINSEYVTNRSFRIQFLRAELYDPKLAAKRIVSHFRVKESIFCQNRNDDGNNGYTDSDSHTFDDSILGRRIWLDDMLPGNHMETIDSGNLQMLPDRDRAGRAILACIPPLRKNPHRDNLFRALWYMFQVVGEDEETQKKGMVVIMYNSGPKRRVDRPAISRLPEFVSGAVVRMSSFHYCLNDTALRPFVSFFQYVMGSFTRTRFRTHFGTPLEVRNELQTYAIPSIIQPISDDGEYVINTYTEWLQRRHEYEKGLKLRQLKEAEQATVGDGDDKIEDEDEEEEEEVQEVILLPRRFDVLYGKSRHALEHTGNLRMMHIIEMCRPRYEKATKVEKTGISMEIVELIYESKGRFLKKGNRGWVEVSKYAARDKVSHHFRRIRENSLKAAAKEAAATVGTTANTTTTTNKQKVAPKRRGSSVDGCQRGSGEDTGGGPSMTNSSATSSGDENMSDGQDGPADETNKRPKTTAVLNETN